MSRSIKVTDATKSITLLLMFLYFVAVMILSYKIEYFKIANTIFIFFMGFVILYRIIKISLIYSKFYVYAAIFITVSVLSYYWAIERSVVASRVETYFSLLVLAVLIINIIETPGDLAFAFKSFVIAGVLMCLYTFFFYGFDELKMMMLEGERIGHEINEANSFGLICGISFTISTCYAVFENKKIFYPISVILAVFTFMTASRTAVIGIIFSLMLIVIFNVASKKIIGTAIFVIIVVILYNLISQSEYFQTMFLRFELFGNFFKNDNMYIADNSTETRMEMMKYGLMWFKDRPIAGYGVDQYNILYEMNFGLRRPSHNFHVQMLVEFGIIGFVLWEVMFISLMKKAYKTIKKRTESKIVFITIAYLVLMGFGNMFTSEKVFWIILGICFSYFYVYRDDYKLAKEAPSDKNYGFVNKQKNDISS